MIYGHVDGNDSNSGYIMPPLDGKGLYRSSLFPFDVESRKKTLKSRNSKKNSTKENFNIWKPG